MTHTAHERAHRDRPLVRHAAERVGFGITAAEISDYTAAIVPATTDSLATPGESIIQARRLRSLSIDLLTRAVLLERALGRSWLQVAAALGESVEYTRGRYGPVEEEWQRDDKFAAKRKTLDEQLLLPRHQVPVTEQEIRKAAEALDAWCLSRHDLSLLHTEGRRQPVTDGIVTP